MAPGLLDARSRRVAEAAVEAALAGIAVAETGVAQAEANKTFLDSELRRTATLAERGLVSTQQQERARLAAETAQQAVEAAQATLLMHQRELESAQAALIDDDGSEAGSCCVEIKAPAAGRVLSIFTESEQVLQAGAALMDIGDPTDLDIEVDVLSTDAVRIGVGASVTVDNWGGSPLRAEVVRVDPMATTRVSALGIEEQRTKVTLHLLDGKPGAGSATAIA